MTSKSTYPWFFFFQVARLVVITFVPPLFILIFFLENNQLSLDKVLVLFLISLILFLFFFYRMTLPLGKILSRVEKFKGEIPFSKNLKLLMKKDEWKSIEEALINADEKLKSQVQDAKKENQKNSAILEAINDAILAIDKFETVLFFNSNFKNNFVTTKESEVIDKKLWHIFSTENETLLSAFREVLSRGRPQSLGAMNFPHSLNPERYFSLNITPLSTSKGEIQGALGVFYDVTNFKLTEKMRVDFVANVSHEIRTPLTSIKGFTQILEAQSSKIDVSLHPFLQKITSNTERMISLFSDLLSLSVIESKDELRLERINLERLIDHATGSILANYPDKKITFIKAVDLPFLTGDTRLIEQVIMNLCDNACKYSHDQVEIKISCFKDQAKKIITITDNGPGIPKEHLGRIFERFYRIDASRESLRGTGLGLSIVKQIITKHKGKIRAESGGEGLGTRFVIEL